MTTIYRQHRQGDRHSSAQRYQRLDVDLRGMPGGPKAALATKGYFAHQRNRCGHQLGRVVASPVRRIAVRWRQKNDQWEYAVVVSTLSAQAVIAETTQPIAPLRSAGRPAGLCPMR